MHENVICVAPCNDCLLWYGRHGVDCVRTHTVNEGVLSYVDKETTLSNTPGRELVGTRDQDGTLTMRSSFTGAVVSTIKNVSQRYAIGGDYVVFVRGRRVMAVNLMDARSSVHGVHLARSPFIFTVTEIGILIIVESECKNYPVVIDLRSKQPSVKQRRIHDDPFESPPADMSLMSCCGNVATWLEYLARPGSLVICSLDPVKYLSDTAKVTQTVVPYRLPAGMILQLNLSMCVVADGMSVSAIKGMNSDMAIVTAVVVQKDNLRHVEHRNCVSLAVHNNCPVLVVNNEGVLDVYTVSISNIPPKTFASKSTQLVRTLKNTVVCRKCREVRMRHEVIGNDTCVLCRNGGYTVAGQYTAAVSYAALNLGADITPELSLVMKYMWKHHNYCWWLGHKPDNKRIVFDRINKNQPMTPRNVMLVNMGDANKITTAASQKACRKLAAMCVQKSMAEYLGRPSHA